MHSIRRFPLVLLPLVATLLAASAALASTTNLTYTAGPLDQDYGAAGVAKLTSVTASTFHFAGTYDTSYNGTLTVTCSNLTPGATYEVWCYTESWYTGGWGLFGSFQADKRGVGSVRGPFGWVNGFELQVMRVDQTTQASTTVLGGGLSH